MRKSLIKPALLASLLSCSSFAVHADEPLSLFEIVLGQPLSIPKCGKDFKHEKQICIVTTLPLHFGAQKHLLEFSDDAGRPAYLFDDEIEASVMDGVVQHVEFHTTGLISQQSVLDLLIVKLGTPDKREIDNSNGIPSIFAMWFRGKDYAALQGAMAPKIGVVEINTAAYANARDADFLKNNPLPPRL